MEIKTQYACFKDAFQAFLRMAAHKKFVSLRLHYLIANDCGQHVATLQMDKSAINPNIEVDTVPPIGFFFKLLEKAKTGAYVLVAVEEIKTEEPAFSPYDESEHNFRFDYTAGESLGI